jgi:hypothetical protein
VVANSIDICISNCYGDYKSMLKCQRCGSNRVADMTAKCSDMCGLSIGEYDNDGYVPGDMGVGGGDYVEMKWCLECGQLQGNWPLPECEAENFDPKKCSCGYDQFDAVGECKNCDEHKELWCPECESQVKFYKLAYNSPMAKGKCGCIVSIENLYDFNKDL